MHQWIKEDAKQGPWSPVSSMAGSQQTDVALNIAYSQTQSQTAQDTAGSVVEKRPNKPENVGQ